MQQASANESCRMKQLKKLIEVSKDEKFFKKFSSPPVKSSHKRAQLTNSLFLKSYEKESKVVFRNVIMPTEIFFAMDIIPVCVETVSASLASFDIAQECLNVAEQNGYSRDICSFIRCSLGASIKDFLPTPDFLACTSYFCDNALKLFYMLSKRYKKECFVLDIPYDCGNEKFVTYLEIQLKEMVRGIEKQLNIKMDPQKLKEAIQFSNEARNYFIKVNDLRRHVPAPIPGYETIDYIAPLTFTWGSKEIIDVYKTLYEEINEKIKSLGNSECRRKPRILWRHLRPYHDKSLIDFIENKCHAEIAFEEANYIYWEEMDPDDPYRGLALKLLSNPAIGVFERWSNVTLDIVEKYKIDGVISFNHWGCKPLGSGEGLLKDILNKKEIPMIELGGDCIDKRDYSFAQLKTRIQAFLEMIREKNI